MPKYTQQQHSPHTTTALLAVLMDGIMTCSSRQARDATHTTHHSKP